MTGDELRARQALRFELDTDATDEQLAKLIQLTERYCVVAQTIRAAVPVTSTASRRT